MSVSMETNSAATSAKFANDDPVLTKIKREPLDLEAVDSTTTEGVLQPTWFLPQSRVTSLPPLLRTMGPSLLNTRIRQVPTPEGVVCDVCQMELPAGQVLQTHKLAHFNTSHLCYVCDSYFAHADTMVLHMASTHRDLQPATKCTSDELVASVTCFVVDGGESLVCPICLQKFSSKMVLTTHQKLHIMKDHRNFGCKICAADFLDSRALISHLGCPRHNEMKVKIQSVFVCVDCRSLFASRDSYAMHMMERAQKESCKSMEVELHELAREEAYQHLINMNSFLHLKERGRTITNGIAHLADVQPETFTCSKCQVDYGSQDALAMHMLLHAQVDASNSPGSIPGPNRPTRSCMSADLVVSRSTTQRPCSRPDSEPVTSTAIFSAPQNSGVKRSRSVGDVNITSQTLFCVTCGCCFDDLPALEGHKRSKEHVIKESQRHHSCLRCGWSSFDPVVLQNHVTYCLHMTTMQTDDVRTVSTPQQPLNLCSRPTTEDDLRPKRKRPSKDTSDATSDVSTLTPQRPKEIDGDVMNFLLRNASSVRMCKHCHIVFPDSTIYHLHMGLHNLSDPFMCNLCGRRCGNVHEFSAHVIHYN